MKFNNIFNKVAVALGATATIALAACSDSDCPNYWDDYYGSYEPAPPVEKPAYIWVDAAANFPYVANDKEAIAAYVTKAKEAGFTDMLVDVRPTNGDVLFKTDRVDQVTSLWSWKRTGNTSVYQETERTADWDYLQAWIDAGHEQGVRIHAAMNTMICGNTAGNGMGMAYRDPSKKEWVSVLNMPDLMDPDPNFSDWVLEDGGLMNTLDISWYKGEIFMNPHHPQVQEFVVGLVSDLATNYPDLDGIILDRGRFIDHRADFSDLTRKQFEEYIGEKLEKWPQDVMPFKATAVPTSDFPKYYKEWWEFRAKAMYEIVTKSAEAAHAANANVQFGCYVGAWYGSYYQNGVNWASPAFDPRIGTDAGVWCSGNYMKYGYADKIDLLILGCYTSPTSLTGPDDWTAQGFAQNGYKRVMGATKVVGGPDFGNWPTENYGYVSADIPKYTKDMFMKAAYDVVGLCSDPLDGFFLFDIIHLQNSPEYWVPVTKALHGEPLNDAATE
ncbi:MAG: family 10 glycosylhydrolase [Clostridiales bacterium]|nr:family 10 glycosylhydrolase [Clostridiales bacterium]